MPEIAIGRKEIMKALHVAEWGTVRRWKQAGLPVRYLPNNKPFIMISEFRAWTIDFDELRKKNTK
ncbi:MAG TPA: hypothetical protein VLH56_17320 [Dissulfurispiraceae bacterium]|nr:hypothetical protein [Dissulfurispiraceae bacterium]